MPSNEFVSILNELYSIFAEEKNTKASSFIKTMSNNMVSKIPNAKILFAQRCKCLKSKQPVVSKAKSGGKSQALSPKAIHPAKPQDTCSSDSSSDNDSEQTKPASAEKNKTTHKSIVPIKKASVPPPNIASSSSDSSGDSSSDEEIKLATTTKIQTASSLQKQNQDTSTVDCSLKKIIPKPKILKEEKTSSEDSSSDESITISAPPKNSKTQCVKKVQKPTVQQPASIKNKAKKKYPSTTFQSSSDSSDSSCDEETGISKKAITQIKTKSGSPQKKTSSVILAEIPSVNKIKPITTSSESEETSSESSEEDSKPLKAHISPLKSKLVSRDESDLPSTKTNLQEIHQTKPKVSDSEKNKSPFATRLHSSEESSSEETSPAQSSSEESSSEDIAPVVVNLPPKKLMETQAEIYNSSSSSISDELSKNKAYQSTTLPKKESSESSSESDSSDSSIQQKVVNRPIPGLKQNPQTKAKKANKPKTIKEELFPEISNTDTGKGQGVSASKKKVKSTKKVDVESKNQSKAVVAKSKTMKAKVAIAPRENLRSKNVKGRKTLIKSELKSSPLIVEEKIVSPHNDKKNTLFGDASMLHESTNVATVSSKSVKKLKSAKNKPALPLPMMENSLAPILPEQSLNISIQGEPQISYDNKRKKSAKSGPSVGKKLNIESSVPEFSPLLNKSSSSNTFKRVSVPIEEIHEALRDNNFHPKNRNESGVHAQLAFQRVQGKDFKREKNKRKKGSFALGAINTSSRSFKFDEEEN